MRNDGEAWWNNPMMEALFVPYMKKLRLFIYVYLYVPNGLYVFMQGGSCRLDPMSVGP